MCSSIPARYASVAIEWLIVEEDTDVARELAAGGQELHAPRLMASEVANALWRTAQLGEIGRGDAGILLAGRLAASGP